MATHCRSRWRSPCEPRRSEPTCDAFGAEYPNGNLRIFSGWFGFFNVHSATQPVELLPKIALPYPTASRSCNGACYITVTTMSHALSDSYLIFSVPVHAHHGHAFCFRAVCTTTAFSTCTASGQFAYQSATKAGDPERLSSHRLCLTWRLGLRWRLPYSQAVPWTWPASAPQTHRQARRRLRVLALDRVVADINHTYQRVTGLCGKQQHTLVCRVF